MLWKLFYLLIIQSTICLPLANPYNALYKTANYLKTKLLINCAAGGCPDLLHAVMQLGGLPVDAYNLAIDAAVAAKNWEAVVQLVEWLESTTLCLDCRQKAIKDIYLNCKTKDRTKYLTSLLNCEEKARIHLFLNVIYESEGENDRPDLEVLDVMFMIPNAFKFTETVLQVYLYIDPDTQITAIQTETVKDFNSFLISVGLARCLNSHLMHYLISRIDIQADNYIVFMLAVEWGNKMVIQALLETAEIPWQVVNTSSRYAISRSVRAILEDYIDTMQFIEPNTSAKAA